MPIYYPLQPTNFAYRTQGRVGVRKTRLAFRRGAFYKEQRENNFRVYMPAATAQTLSDLRRSLAEAALQAGPVAGGRIGLGVPSLDEALSGGLARAALHE